MIKKLVLVLIGLFIIVTVVGFLLPSDYDVERSIVIQGDGPAVFPYINNLQKWQAWTPWNKEKYPSMTQTYSGPEEGVGAKSAWKDPESGSGNLEIKTSDPEKGITYDLAFEGYSMSQGRIAMETVEGGVKVTMGMKGEMGGNPYTKYFGLLMDSAMGGEFEEGLNSLKTVIEKRPGEGAPAPK